MKQKIRFFNCLVRLGGEPVINLTPKRNVSEYEIRVLRYLHGEDAVQRVVEIEPRDIDKAEHLYELAFQYGGSDLGTQDRPVGRAMVEKLFNVSLDNFNAWLEETLEREAEDREIRNRERLERSRNNGMATVSGPGANAAPSDPGQPSLSEMLEQQLPPSQAAVNGDMDPPAARGNRVVD
jgi:hypothetical protein